LIDLCEDEIICDLAETYHIYDYREWPLNKVAIFVCGLKEDSRTMLIYSGQKVSFEKYMLASAVDSLNFIAWSKTKDAAKGRKQPKRFVDILLGKNEKNDLQKFQSGEDFLSAWNS
jgi:hypothetical protein